MGFTRCDTCGKYFTGTPSFDAHRTGEYYRAAYVKGGVKIPARANTRRCLTTEEMVVGGFAEEERHGRREWYVIKSRLRWLSREMRKPNSDGSEEERDMQEYRDWMKVDGLLICKHCGGTVQPATAEERELFLEDHELSCSWGHGHYPLPEHIAERLRVRGVDWQ